MKILPGLEHEITLETDEGLALGFFKGKVRNAYPRVVKLNMTDALATRAYWVEVLEGKAGRSSVDARVTSGDAGSVIEIHTHDVKKMRVYLRAELLPKAGGLQIVWNGKTVSREPVREECSGAGDDANYLGEVRELSAP